MPAPRPPCHVGVAFYSFPGFPLQWVLVLSKHRLFEGTAWCNSAIETVDGWRQSSKKCTWSPAALDPMGVFCGVIHIAFSSVPIKQLQEAVSRYKIASDAGHLSVPDSEMTERYVIRVLLRLCRGRSLKLPTQDPIALADMIRKRTSIFQAVQCSATDNTFPVVRLMKHGIFYGRLLR